MGRFSPLKSSKLFEKTLEEDRPQRNRFSVLSGRMTRRLMTDKRLTGDVLDFALIIARDVGVAEKLKKGQPLGDNEKHLMNNVWMLQMRLGTNQGKK
jgi:hypothetical protein